MRPRRGFTIIELVVVSLLVAILSGFLYSVVKVGVDAWVLLASRKAAYEEGYLTLNAILDEIRSIDVTRVRVEFSDTDDAMDPDYDGPVEIRQYTMPDYPIKTGTAYHMQARRVPMSFGTIYDGMDTGGMIDVYYDENNGTIVIGDRVAETDVTSFEFSYGSPGAYTNTLGEQYGAADLIRVKFTISRRGQEIKLCATAAPRTGLSYYLWGFTEKAP